MQTQAYLVLNENQEKSSDDPDTFNQATSNGQWFKVMLTVEVLGGGEESKDEKKLEKKN